MAMLGQAFPYRICYTCRRNQILRNSRFSHYGCNECDAVHLVVHLQGRRFSQHVPPKRRYTRTRLHDVTSHRTHSHSDCVKWNLSSHARRSDLCAEDCGNKLFPKFVTFYQIARWNAGIWVVMKSAILPDITPCCPLRVSQAFGGTCQLHF
jgi:hypothetical protein